MSWMIYPHKFKCKKCGQEVHDLGEFLNHECQKEKKQLRCSACGWAGDSLTVLFQCRNCKMLFCESCIDTHYNSCVFTNSDLTGDNVNEA